MGEKVVLENDIIVDYTLRGDNDYDIVVTKTNPDTGKEDPFTSDVIDIPAVVTAPGLGDLLIELRKWKIQHEMVKNILKVKLRKISELNVSMGKDGTLIVKRNNDVEIFRVEKKPDTPGVYLIIRSGHDDKEIKKRVYVQMLNTVGKVWVTKSL